MKRYTMVSEAVARDLRRIMGILALVVCLLLRALGTEQQVSFEANYYTYPQIAKRLSVGGRTVRCSRSLRERLALLSLKPRAWETTIQILSKGLGIRFRLVDEDRRVWQMEPDPQQVDLERRHYSQWQKLAEQAFQQFGQLLFSVQFDRRDWEFIQTLAHTLPVTTINEQALYLQDTLGESQLTPQLQKWLNIVDTLPASVFADNFSYGMPSEALSSRKIWALLNLARMHKSPAKPHLAMWTLLAANRAWLMPDLRECISWLSSNRVLNLGEANLPEETKTWLMEILQINNMEQLHEYKILVWLKWYDFNNFSIKIALLHCAPNPEDKLVRPTYEYDFVVQVLPQVYEAGEASNTPNIVRRLRLFSEELAKQWEYYQSLEEKLLQSQLATHTARWSDWHYGLPLSTLLQLWAIETNQEIVLEVFPACEGWFRFPIDAVKNGKYSLKSIIDAYRRCYNDERLVFGRLLFYEERGILFARNVLSFADRSLNLPLASYKEILCNTQLHPIVRLQQYARATTLQNQMGYAMVRRWRLCDVVASGSGERLVVTHPYLNNLLKMWQIGRVVDALSRQVQLSPNKRFETVIDARSLPASLAQDLLTITYLQWNTQAHQKFKLVCGRQADIDQWYLDFSFVNPEELPEEFGGGYARKLRQIGYEEFYIHLEGLPRGTVEDAGVSFFYLGVRGRSNK